MSRRRNPGEDPFATTAPPSSAPRGAGPMTKGDKLFLGGAFLLGVLGVVAWKKGNLWSPYRAPPSPSPSPRPTPGYAPSGGRTAAVAPPAAPAADPNDSAPVDPSQMTASFGDTPATGGGYYDSPPGG